MWSNVSRQLIQKICTRSHCPNAGKRELCLCEIGYALNIFGLSVLIHRDLFFWIMLIDGITFILFITNAYCSHSCHAWLPACSPMYRDRGRTCTLRQCAALDLFFIWLPWGSAEVRKHRHCDSVKTRMYMFIAEEGTSYLLVFLINTKWYLCVYKFKWYILWYTSVVTLITWKAILVPLSSWIFY